MGGTGHGRCQRGGHGFRGGNNRDISTPRPNVTGYYHEKWIIGLKNTGVDDEQDVNHTM